MKCIHIVGRKNHGKTTLILELVRELTRRGLRVGTIKHTHHVHELDRPGTDSFQQRQAGAAPAAIVTSDLIGVYLPCTADTNYQERLAPLFAGCDVLLIEGDLEGRDQKIEVWREALGTPCLAQDRADIAAVVTDDPLTTSAPIFPRSDLEALMEYIVSYISNNNRSLSGVGTPSMTDVPGGAAAIPSRAPRACRNK